MDSSRPCVWRPRHASTDPIPDALPGFGGQGGGDRDRLARTDTACFPSPSQDSGGVLIERATYDSLAFRFIAANSHPDHDTLSTFRRRFAKAFEGAFVQVLRVARENQLSRFGTVSLDGTKIHAKARRHSSLSYRHAEAIEAQLKGEVQELLALAEEADAANLPDGMSLPEELKEPVGLSGLHP